MTPARARQPSRHVHPGRRACLRGLAALAGTLAAPLTLQAAAPAGPLVEVWKDPSCGCCGDWVAHLQAHGFQTRVHDTGNEAARARLGIAPRFGSCHTALVGGYAIEGHVPARDIQRLLRDKPQAIGLAVPGMPVGSPGMDGPAYAGRRDAYAVLLLLPDGRSSIWQAHR